jgi:hypothetical protein
MKLEQLNEARRLLEELEKQQGNDPLFIFNKDKTHVLCYNYETDKEEWVSIEVVDI